MLIRCLSIITLVLFALACKIDSGSHHTVNSLPENLHFKKEVNNIILLIGDGMGLTQLYAGFTANKGKLNIEQCRYIGVQKTYSADNYITDSGAAGTALATGHKTNNRTLGLSPESVKLKTISEIAAENGLSTGIIVTCSITDATPAAFYAHQASRYSDENIALDFIHHSIDVAICGGRKYFNTRSDHLNLIDSLKVKGYIVDSNINQLTSSDTSKVIIFTAEDKDPKISEGRGNLLPDATEKALHILARNKKGFFLMIEGSQIDWGGHSNDQNYVINELLDFDRAVGKALQFAAEDSSTLVIVTGDHETGGLSILNGNLKTGDLTCAFSTSNHTGTWIPVFAYGPYAENFSGFYQNTDVFYKMLNAFNFQPIDKK